MNKTIYMHLVRIY